MKRKPCKMIVNIVAMVLLALLMQGCGSVITGPPDGNTVESTVEKETVEVTTEKPATEEPTTEESTAEESVTEEPTTEEPTTEEPTTEELPTREPTPYDEVLDEYFAQREKLYAATEKPEFDPERWQYIQEWKEVLGGITIRSAEVTYIIDEVISETETEVKLRVFEYELLTYVCNGYDVERTTHIEWPHIIRLSKREEEYQIMVDSCWSKVSWYQSGLAEDIELLKPRAGTVAD